MAFIKKDRARKELEKGSPTPSISNWPNDGLRFNIEIGEHKLSLSHVERDAIIEGWKRLETDFLR